MVETLAYADPDHEGNSAKYHTGKTCITKGCEQPARALAAALMEADNG